jgi:acyl-coenzyme A synthetase/AMP-(fatty) acid ligase
MKVETSRRLLPLIRHDDPGAIVAHRAGQPITAARFLADVHLLAETLPPRTHVTNRCADRYRFAVGFAAALLREQITLLPPNDTPELLRQLANQYPQMYCLTDEPMAVSVLDQVLYPSSFRPADTDFGVPAFDENQIATLIFTSGSTGQPTPHAKRWGILVASAQRAGKRLSVAKLPGAAVMATVPPQHSYGLESSVMLALQNGLALTASRAFYPADIVQHLEMLPRPRILVTTPIHLRLLNADPAPVPHADLLVSATAPLTPAMAAEAEARFGCPLIEIYGCAEAGQTALRRTSQDVEWRCLEGISLTQDPQGTWANGDLLDHRVLLSDVIELHGIDRFMLQGRTADLVNIAGKRTSLAHLNFHLNAIEGVRDGVFVMPEGKDDRATRLAAFVVAPSLSAKAVTRELRKRIDPIFLPRPLCFVDALPRAETGKLARKDIERLLAGASAAQQGTATAEIVFSADEPSVSGHFPGDPIIPGAVLLQEVLSALQDKTDRFMDSCQIRSGKFLRPVRPGERMEIRWAMTENGDIRFDCSVSEQLVLTGTIGDGEAAS